MKFSIQRETLLKPLQAIIGVVERRHTMPILANILLEVKDGELRMTATDTEVELIARVPNVTGEEGAITVPGKKLVDIIRSLPENAHIEFILDKKHKFTVQSGRSRFLLSHLPAEGFPNVSLELGDKSVDLPQKTLMQLLKRTYFAMAQQDVRYFLNGMLLELNGNVIKTVATDGHRLALSAATIADTQLPLMQVIIPRKAVLELMRLVEEIDDPVTLILGVNHIRAVLPEYTFTSKLLDGRYPDYSRVIPKEGVNKMHADRDTLKQALSRTAILSNEKYRGVRLQLGEGLLKLMANNPEQEEAQDELEVKYQGEKIEIGFNVSYLLDVLGVLDNGDVQMSLANANSSALIHTAGKPDSVYVVMPIKL